LHEDVIALARWLVEGIATLAGPHAGDVVRDAVEAALGQPRDANPPQSLSSRSYHGERDGLHRDPYRDPYGPEDERDSWSESSRPAEEASPGSIIPPWWSLLPVGLQLLAVWLRQQKGRSQLVAMLGIGVASVLTFRTIGPVVGTLVASAGMAYTFAGLVQGLTDLIVGLSSVDAA